MELIMPTTYEHENIERSAQRFWDEKQSFTAKEDLNSEKFYCLAMLPYPSGELHMGHVRNYTLADVIARHAHLQGKNVLHPMGWDAFGLPAENAAIKHQLPPAEWTEKNIKKMRKQFIQLGLSYDWSREIKTCSPDYYRWEQWLFIQLYKKGLVYKKNSIVNWDPVDQTVLANEQVVDGKGWRSGAVVERREIPQWFFKITEYAEELLDDIDKLDGWPEQVRQMQKNWIGRSKGVSIKFTVIKHPKNPITTFTTRADTLMGATYLSIALEHPIAVAAAENNPGVAKFIKKMRKTKVSEAELEQQEKVGIYTGINAIHPITKKHIPIWITNFVLIEYGTGAVMSVPAHDQRDFDFAKKYNIPIKQVIFLKNKSIEENLTKPILEPGTLVQSGEYDGLKTKKAKKVIAEFLESKGVGTRTTNYRLRDWGISRQRYWGAPIPMVYCKQCGAQPVNESDLPVELPTNLIPSGKSSPLTSCSEFYKTTCPSCGKSAKRETDTMDTFVESSWYYARYCCNDQDNSMLDDRAKFWTPVDQYVGGIEHAVMHLLYARFMHKVLRDEGLVNSSEPFNRLLTQGMVLKDGAKMSKSKGNTVSPQALIKDYGCDAVRFFTIFAAPPEQNLEWSDSGIEGAYRFIKKLWGFVNQHKETLAEFNQDEKASFQYENKSLQKIQREIHTELQKISYDMDRQQFNTVASGAMKLLNICTKIPVDDNQSTESLHEGISILLRILSPIAPHICHHLWRDCHFEGDILQASWPKVNLKALVTAEINLIVQINGKRRTTITVKPDDVNADIEKIALDNDIVKQYAEDKPIKKCIIVPKRLINIVI
jgi:leucyl-tRNA synthetase